MNPHETSKKYLFSYCVDRCVMRDRLEALYHELTGSAEGDVLALNFGDLEVHIVIIDDREKDEED